MCMDRYGFEWFKALLAHEKPPEGKVWLVYTLKGGSDASNDDPFASRPLQSGRRAILVIPGPPIITCGPVWTHFLPVCGSLAVSYGSTASVERSRHVGFAPMLDSYPATADDTRKPYIMFGGTPYEHVMFPVQ